MLLLLNTIATSQILPVDVEFRKPSFSRKYLRREAVSMGHASLLGHRSWQFP